MCLLFVSEYNYVLYRYFVMNGIVICTELNGFSRYMLYAWSFSRNTLVTIAIKYNKSYVFNIHITISWGAVNSYKNRTYTV